jgi:acetolactate synthase-1/2/3 large subunit
MSKPRGADLVAQTLARAGVKRLFSLSGNHVMNLYDAALDARLAITHVRHEGAAVHMADAWARLTGEPGVTLFTGGPGHANAVGALYTALASESPVVMLSGHAPLSEVGRGSFQEIRQAEMAAPVAKESWTAQSAATLGEDIARAIRVARSGRPGPVHVSLPFDLLEERADGDGVPSADAFQALPAELGEHPADAALELLAKAQRPLILTGSAMSGDRDGGLRAKLAEAAGVPVICMEGPRGLADASLGAVAGVIARADAILLLGKQPDFSLRFGKAPAIASDCRVAIIDPDPDVLHRAAKALGAARTALSAHAATLPAARRLIERCAGRRVKESAWNSEVEAALSTRPALWKTHAPRPDGPVHPLDVARAIQARLDASPGTVLIADGGEYCQWIQAGTRAKARLINGPAGSIGGGIPFALGAKLARPRSPVIATSGDGSAGYHLLEIETALREKLAFTVVIGNDARWNAEHQIQLRAYGKDRAFGCELLPSRYDQVAVALGGHGEHVTRPADLPAALERAAASGKPAVVNVVIEGAAAPSV